MGSATLQTARKLIKCVTAPVLFLSVGIKLNIMGEIADMMIDGILDEQTGEYIGEAVGYPRTMQQGFYNSVKKRKPKRNIKHAMKGESLGGLHLVGKKATIENVGECKIVDYVGKRGRKRYILIDNKGNEYRRRFSCFKLCDSKNKTYTNAD